MPAAKLRRYWLTLLLVHSIVIHAQFTELCKIIPTSFSDAAPTSHLDCCSLSKGLGQPTPRVLRLWTTMSLLVLLVLLRDPRLHRMVGSRQ